MNYNEDDETTPTPATPPKKKKVKKNSIVELDEELTKIDKQIEQLSSRKEDEAYSYAMSIAERLRRLDNYQFAMARLKIEQLLIDIEFKCNTSTGDNQLYFHNSNEYQYQEL